LTPIKIHFFWEPLDEEKYKINSKRSVLIILMTDNGPRNTLKEAREFSPDAVMLASPDQQEFIQLVAATPAYQDAETFREQLTIFESLRYDFGGAQFSMSVLANIFSVNKGSIDWQLKRIHQKPKPNGRPTILPDEAYEMIHYFVFSRYENKEATSYNFINEQLALNFDVHVQPNTLRHIVAKFEDIKTVTGKPMEDERIRVSIGKIEEYFVELESLFSNRIPAAFVINADET
jgi:hypothetical protein